MKLKNILSILISSNFIISCTSSSTEYNGYLKNSLSSTVTFETKGDNLLYDSISLAPGATQKIYTKIEEGDFEIYDCRYFFDTIFYKSGGEQVSISSDSAVISTNSILESKNMRIHSCIIEISN